MNLQPGGVTASTLVDEKSSPAFFLLTVQIASFTSTQMTHPTHQPRHRSLLSPHLLASAPLLPPPYSPQHNQTHLNLPLRITHPHPYHHAHQVSNIHPLTHSTSTPSTSSLSPRVHPYPTPTPTSPPPTPPTPLPTLRPHPPPPRIIYPQPPHQKSEPRPANISPPNATQRNVPTRFHPQITKHACWLDLSRLFARDRGGERLGGGLDGVGGLGVWVFGCGDLVRREGAG